MLGKMEVRTPPGGRPRDGRHCDLCGCSQPAVRCDKCGCQIFCLSCDDMYHRHPKRRFHLRKAVDTTPTTQQARPVLPVKVAHLNTMNPGDPSKMPLPPPRKKKSLFGSFRRPSPSSDNSPPLPKKEYSWTDRLGSIKKFMSNRPLPPLPTADDHDGENQPTTNGQTTPPRGDLSFIHKRSEERPPQLPARSPRPQDFPGFNPEKDPRAQNNPAQLPGQFRNGTLDPNMNHMNQNRQFSGDEGQWNNGIPNQNGAQAFGTLNRQNNRGFIPPGGPGFPGGMHQSSSATDLHSLHNAEAIPGTGPMPPHYPHYPMNPHMPPHYPYPMYPQYPNYPQYFGNSFANLSNPPTTDDGDLSDSETSTRHSSKKHPFRKKAKRSQSVLMDRMAYPGQFYPPFGPYPGYGPWGAPMPMEAPPSPASSIRSLNRTGRTRRRKKMTSEEDDEEFSVSSSPLSRPKSSSSERHQKESQRAPLATQTTSSEDESEYEGDRRRNKTSTIQRRTSEPMRTPSSPATDRKRPPKMKKKSSKQTDSEPPDVSEVQNERRTSNDSNADQPAQELPSSSSSPPSSTWECKHCTFINPLSNNICVVCCKTASPRTETPVTANSRPSSAAESARKQSVSSEKNCSSPEKALENDDDGSRRDKQDMAILNSALDEAEKEISRGLEELMKLKDDMDGSVSKEKNTKSSKETETNEKSKPVYKPTGRMKTSILDKLNINKPQTSKSMSTSTEVQTDQNSRTTDKIIEARRYSNSSTTSEAYNSPLAQSPELGDGFNKQKRDSSCQTQKDNLAEYLERKRAAEEAYIGRPVNNFGFGYGDRMDMMTSPVPSMYDRYIDRGFGMMQRSHSRASLFTGRLNDLGPMEYGGGPAFGYGAAPMYRSVSRGSLTGDYPEGRMSDFQNLRRPDYYLSMEELVERRRQDDMRAQGLELVRMIREAEQQGFTADDIQVALTHCGKQSPMEWLQNNWRNMVDSVITLSTNYGNDKKENDIGLLSESEARDSLRLHKGNIWAAVTECVEGRQRKYLELSARGKFARQEIIDALTASDGDVEMAYANLSKTTGKPFLMRIWGAGEGAQNQDGAQPIPEDLKNARYLYEKSDIANCDDLSDDLWSEDGEVNWEEDEDDYEGERGDFEDLQTCHEDLHSGHEDLHSGHEDLQTCHEDLETYHEDLRYGSHEIRTPDSDKSDYCDAFALQDKNMSPISDDIFFVIPETKPEKKKGFLSKLAALRKDSKENIEILSSVKEDIPPEQIPESKNDTVSQNSNSSTEQTKGNGALSAIKNTFSAIKDTVTGASKSDKKSPCSQPERRTIIVTGQLDNETLTANSKNNVKLTSVKSLDDDNLLNQISEIELKETSKDSNEQTKRGDAKPSTKEVIVTPDSQISADRKTNQIQNMFETSSKQPDLGNKIENKKPQTLAERLKFAKQSHTSKTASNSKEIKKDIDIKYTTNLNTPSLHENSTSAQEIELKHADEKKEEAILSNNVSKIPANERKDEVMRTENFTSDSIGKNKTSDHQSIHEENYKQNINQNVIPSNSISSSSSVQSQSKACNEGIASTSAKAASTKNLVDDVIITKKQELSLDNSLINKKAELVPGMAEVSNSHKIVSEHVIVSDQNSPLQNALNLGEMKGTDNIFATDNSNTLKSDVNAKSKASIKDASSDSKKTSNKSILNNSLEMPISSEKHDECRVNSGMKTFREVSKGMPSETSNSTGNEKSDMVSQKINNFQVEIKSKIPPISFNVVNNVSKRSEDNSIPNETLIQTSESKSDISSSIAKVSISPDLPSNSKIKDSTEGEAKQDISITLSEKINIISESKQEMPISSAGTISNIPKSKHDTSPSPFDENNARLQTVASKPKTLGVLDTVQNVSSSEMIITNTATDKDVISKGGATEIFKNEPQEINNTLLENKQGDIQNTEINNQDLSTNTVEINNLPAESLPCSSKVAHVSVESEISKPQLDLNEKVSEFLKDKSKLSTDIENIDQSNTTQHVEYVDKEKATEIGKHTETSASISHPEQLPGQENVQTSNLIQHPESTSGQSEGVSVANGNSTVSEKDAEGTVIPSKSGDAKRGQSESVIGTINVNVEKISAKISEKDAINTSMPLKSDDAKVGQSEDVIDAINVIVEKGNVTISEKDAKDTSIPSESGDAKVGKTKTSKTGKAKKLSKDNKELKTKNLIKSETSPITNVTNASSSMNKKEGKVTESSDIVNLASETSITSVSNASSSTNETESKSGRDSNTVNLETELSNTVNKEPESSIVKNKQDLNLINVENIRLIPQTDTKAHSSQDYVFTSANKLPTLNDSSELQNISTHIPDSKLTSEISSESQPSVSADNIIFKSTSGVKIVEKSENSKITENVQSIQISNETKPELPSNHVAKNIPHESSNNELINVIEDTENKLRIASQTDSSTSSKASESSTGNSAESNIAASSKLPKSVTDIKTLEPIETTEPTLSSSALNQSEQHSTIQNAVTDAPPPDKETINATSSQQSSENMPEKLDNGTTKATSSQQSSETTSENVTETDDNTSQKNDSDDTDIQYSDDSRPSSVTPPSPVDALRNRFEGLSDGTSMRGSLRPQSPFRRMSFNSRKQVIALERIRDTSIDKPWFHPKTIEPVKVVIPKRTIKQQLEMERRVRKMVSDRKVRTYRKAEIVVQLMDLNFEEEEAILAATECSTLEMAISYLQQECQLCAGHFPVSQIVSMTHCEHRACRECIRAYFTVQIRDRTILDLLCPFCNEPDIGDEDIAQDYFNHLDIMLKKLVDMEIHELFQRKLRDRVLMKDPNFRWCSQCSSGFIAMPNLKRLVCPDCNAVTCASCRRLWERDHQGISCEAFAALKVSSDVEEQAVGIAKMLTEDGISCPSCHFRYALAKGGCMHFRCIQCQHDFCSGCSRPFKMGQKCGVSEFCVKLGLHAHHPRNCLFYLRDKEPEDLQKLLDMNDVQYNKEPSEGMELKSTCQVLEQKETTDGMIDDHCGKEVQDGFAGLCRIHYVEYLGQLVNKHKVDPIQIFDTDDLELVLRRASIRLPPKRYRETDEQYKEKLVNLIQEELPLDKMDGS